MNGLKGFNARRFFLLIRNDLFLNRSFFLIYSAVVVGIVVLFSALQAIQSAPPQGFQANYRILLYIGAFIAGGRMFKGLHNEIKGTAWLTLPASVFEKFISRMVLLLVLFPLWLMALFSLMSLITWVTNSVFPGGSTVFFNPFSKATMVTTLRYLVLISLYNLGLIYFKKDALGKTFLSVFLYQLFLCLVVIMGLRVFFGLNFLHINDPVRTVFELLNGNGKFGQAWSITKWTIHIGFWYVLAPLCWVTGYIRLKEKEV
jgi:hypothetical protein